MKSYGTTDTDTTASADQNRDRLLQAQARLVSTNDSLARSEQIALESG